LICAPPPFPMGACQSNPSGANTTDRAVKVMSQAKMDSALAKVVATKQERIPPLDRERVWADAEVAALSDESQGWEHLEGDEMGVHFDYPSNWELLPPLRVGGTRYDRVVRTAHLLRPNHLRPSAEMAVGFAHFNNRKLNESISVENFIVFTDKMTESARKLPGAQLLAHETLPAGAFKGNTHPVVHNMLTFAQNDGTTSHVEQWLILSRDQTIMCTLTIFNGDLPCRETYGNVQRRWLESVQVAKFHLVSQF